MLCPLGPEPLVLSSRVFLLEAMELPTIQVLWPQKPELSVVRLQVMLARVLLSQALYLRVLSSPVQGLRTMSEPELPATWLRGLNLYRVWPRELELQALLLGAPWAWELPMLRLLRLGSLAGPQRRSTLHRRGGCLCWTGSA